jgi:hypothetical protein
MVFRRLAFPGHIFSFQPCPDFDKAAAWSIQFACFIPPQLAMTPRSTSHERPHSPPSPTLTYHPSLFPANIPTPALLESVAGGAHYSGVKIERDSHKMRRNSSGIRTSHLQIKGDHQQVLDDMTELYCCRPTREIFERRWRPDARFEVRPVV